MTEKEPRIKIPFALTPSVLDIPFQKKDRRVKERHVSAEVMQFLKKIGMRGIRLSDSAIIGIDSNYVVMFHLRYANVGLPIRKIMFRSRKKIHLELGLDKFYEYMRERINER